MRSANVIPYELAEISIAIGVPPARIIVGLYSDYIKDEVISILKVITDDGKSARLKVSFYEDQDQLIERYVYIKMNNVCRLVKPKIAPWGWKDPI